MYLPNLLYLFDLLNPPETPDPMFLNLLDLQFLADLMFQISDLLDLLDLLELPNLPDLLYLFDVSKSFHTSWILMNFQKSLNLKYIPDFPNLPGPLDQLGLSRPYRTQSFWTPLTSRTSQT